MVHLRTLLTATLISALAVVLPTVPVNAQTPATRCDFNADGHADLATGVRGEDVAGQRRAGAVQVMFGSAGRREDRDGNSGSLRPVANNLWHQNDGAAGAAEPDDRVGAALACGDFDGDGIGDLAVGVAGEEVGGKRAGAVQVLYGSDQGWSGDDLWHQNDRGIDGAVEPGDRFGAALTSGDLDADGYDDLVVGVPGEGIGGDNGAGAVQVLYGSADGVSQRNELWHQDSRGFEGGSERGDRFGAALAAGDLLGDGSADVVVGVPGEDVGGVANAGAIQVLYTTAEGLDGDALWHQASRGMNGATEAGDRFGRAVAAADLDADGHDEAIVGVPREDVAGTDDAGAVQIAYGSAEGLTGRDAMWHQDTRGVAGTAGSSDRFGSSVTTGDFDGDGHVDLAAGAVGEEIGGDDGAGAIHVLFASTDGITTRDQLWHQDDRGVEGGAEPGDHFGFSLFAADIDADGRDDVAIGVPDEDVAGERRAGAVQTLYGSDTGLTSRGELWHQGDDDTDRCACDESVTGAPERNDRFGWSLP